MTHILNVKQSFMLNDAASTAAAPVLILTCVGVLHIINMEHI